MDPFMYLTVPLPIKQTRTFKCHFVPLDTEADVIQAELLIPVHASFADIKKRLGELVKVKPEHVRVCLRR